MKGVSTGFAPLHLSALAAPLPTAIHGAIISARAAIQVSQSLNNRSMNHSRPEHHHNRVNFSPNSQNLYKRAGTSSLVCIADLFLHSLNISYLDPYQTLAKRAPSHHAFYKNHLNSSELCHCSCCKSSPPRRIDRVSQRSRMWPHPWRVFTLQRLRPKEPTIPSEHNGSGPGNRHRSCGRGRYSLPKPSQR